MAIPIQLMDEPDPAAEHEEYDPGYVRLQAETRMTAILDGKRPRRPTSDFISAVFDLRQKPAFATAAGSTKARL